ncbi:hypothetical protein XO10_02240 [Marinitoga sp. 1135]|uniref:glycosyltransferase n=1 Tax=unclassified Marinitoga TaxID=2640159 RepID=UPI00158633F4|nr:MULTISPECIES: glycosyltransferase [unclassified Marinitoga]NUU95112.1 hypothetical protein [Marinitoga sp. 1135]NUU97044.1 hypothetical protein [Marinitoga sp. 1138]
MKKEKVAGLILTHNRKELLKKGINALLNQTYELEKILIVNNNSTDGTKEYLESLNNDKIEVLNINENIGSGGGYHEGIKYLEKEEKYDWIWLMDDDALPEKKALEKMINAYLSLPENKRNNTAVLQNDVITIEEDFFKKTNDNNTNIWLKKREFTVFVGFMIKTSVVKEVGYPKKEYFVGFEDVEYGFRIRRRGYYMYTVKGAYIFHKAWNFAESWEDTILYDETKNIEPERIKKRFIFKKVNVDGWRLYYHFRNAYNAFEEEPNIFLRSLGKLWLYYDRFVWSIVEKDKLKFVDLGLEHGKKNIMGITMLPSKSKEPILVDKIKQYK